VGPQDDDDAYYFHASGSTGSGTSGTKKLEYQPPDPKWDEHAEKEQQSDKENPSYTPLAVPDSDHRFHT
jgi:hypothetical protein